MATYKEALQKQLDAAQAEYLDEKRQKYIEIEGSEPTEEELLEWMGWGDEDNQNRSKSEIFSKALVRMGDASAKIGRVMLMLMWHVWKDGLYLMVEEDSVEGWATTTLQGYNVDMDYMKALARVVDNIFPWVYQHELDDNPIETDEDQPIVVEGAGEDNEINLITANGLISKLKENAAFLHGMEDEEDKIEFLKMLVTEPRSKLQAHKAKTKNKQTKINLTGLKFKLTKEMDGDKIKVTIPEQNVTLTPQQYKAFVQKFSDYLEIDE